MKQHDYTPGRPLRMYKSDRSFEDFSTDRLVGQRLNSFTGWDCGAGAGNLYIDMDGKVFGASCRLKGQLGNIFDDISLPQKWITCSKQICSCGADLFIPKVRTPSDQRFLSKTFPSASQDPQLPRDTVCPPSNNEFVAIERTHSSNLKQIYWEIGRRCNYNCSYCWPWIHNATDAHKSLEQLIQATLLIEEKFCKGSRAAFVISGGEPALNPALMDWVKFLHSLHHKISMHSNGFRPPEYYVELIHYTNLNLSVHFEFMKPAHLLQVISALAAEKHRVRNINIGHLEVKLMMKPGFTQDTLEFEQELKTIKHFAKHCTWAIVPIRDGHQGDQIMDGYSEADFALFDVRTYSP